MTVYHVETQGDYDALMIELEEKGYEWGSGEKPTKLDKFKDYGKDTYIYEEYGGIISFSDGYYFKVYRSNETLIEYKAKGENMTQEEMKQKLHENALDVFVKVQPFYKSTSESESDLQEAKSSAKKLIEKIDDYLETLKPKFKVGDYVTVYVNGKEKIAKIDELTENNSKAHGLWYDRTFVYVTQDYWFTSGINEFRHARPTEIVEYEAALTFHKHGRKPFGVKDGDILRDDKGNILISDDNIFSADSPKNLKKEYFISGHYTFIKTAEEVNEWLDNK